MRQRVLDLEPRLYEMMVVVAPTVGEEGLPAVIERVSGYVTTYGGEIASTKAENPWGRRRLAYQIDDHRDAFFVLYTYNAAPNAIVEIEREIKIDEQVIRHLVVRYDEMTEHEERAPRVPASAGGSETAPRRAPAVEREAAPARPDEPAAAVVATEPAPEPELDPVATATETAIATATAEADEEPTEPEATPEEDGGEPA